MKSSTIKFLVIFFISTTVFHTKPMESHNAESFFTFLFGALHALNESSQTIKSLEKLTMLNEKILTEGLISQALKERIQRYEHLNKTTIKTIQENTFNIGIYEALPCIFRGITFFVDFLEENASQEPAIKDNLENYYSMLGKLAVVNNRVTNSQTNG